MIEGAMCCALRYINYENKKIYYWQKQSIVKCAEYKEKCVFLSFQSYLLQINGRFGCRKYWLFGFEAPNSFS